ncbi:MAG: TIGR04283 family arsenosugar biosynthesis glycosyltransferase [Gammaproteobacteria bacterium]|nr:TIGR04283 family arsenosugar biosynthesis glycosyltransferase [Gammaproteobacteria bacterium]
MRIAIIIPVLEEAALIAGSLARLQRMRQAGHELIVVDGGSRDGTPDLARPLADRVITAAHGRARQMNAGAEAARSDVLLFLHADIRLSQDAAEQIATATANGALWGRFDVRLCGDGKLLRIVAQCMNWRSRLTGIATGDQAVFVRRDVFKHAGGYPDIPLMEDIAMSKLLRKQHFPARLVGPAWVSSRRWQRNGVLRTILLMWYLRLAYFLGADTRRLAARYGNGPRQERIDG